jgi:glutamate synthase (NADPH/NADH) large chain
MTGGTVLILGNTGVNFAAGMSGGVAFVYDENQLFDTRCNLDMVDVEPVIEDQDKEVLKNLIERHIQYTDSKIGQSIMDSWDESLPLFVKVMPLDYKKALEKIKQEESTYNEIETVTEEVYN